jgi:hypothetical protein
MPSKVFTDQELMTIGNAVLQQHGRPMDDSEQVRKSYALMPSPPPGWYPRPAEPSECAVFHEPWQHEPQLDLTMGLALGLVPIGGWPGPGLILLDLRSAPRDVLAKADFDYTDELLSRCATFDTTVTDTRGPEVFTVHLLPSPKIGEKAYAMKTSWQGNDIRLGLRVLAGTLSIDMGSNRELGVSDADALALMEQVAQQLVDEAGKSARG